MNAHTCPICRKAQASDRYAPFCSRRCADVDLGRWFAGAYAVPADDEDEAPPMPGGEDAQ